MDDRIKMIADHYGYESQSRQLIEEMAEVSESEAAQYDKAIAKVVFNDEQQG